MAKTVGEQADEIESLMKSGQSAEQIMNTRSDLSNGWNLAAKRLVAKQPPAPPGPDRPILSAMGAPPKSPLRRQL